MSNFTEEYAKAYTELLRTNANRFILFRPRDGCGWGNKLRGLTLCFVFALCTKRILVVDDPIIAEHFFPPDGTNWSINRWSKTLRSITDRRVMNLHLRPEDFSREEWRDYETKSMDSLFPERLVILEQSIGFIDALFRNPRHEPFLGSIGLNTNSKLFWLGSICEYMLARPTRKLTKSIIKVSKKLQFLQKADFGIQFRSFYDVGYSNVKYLEPFLMSVRSDILRTACANSRPTIYILTDDPEITRTLSRKLEDLGRIMSWPHDTVHTAETNTGMAKKMERVLVKLFGNRAQNVDFLAWMPKEWRPRAHTSVLAEWFLLGECKRIYSTFSSFAVFAAARTRNKAALIRFDTSTGTLSPMKNELYFY